MSKAYLESPEAAANVASARGVKLPRKSYLLRCINCEFGRSKIKTNPETGETSGNNPMFTRTWEIVSPERVRILNTEKTKEKGENVYDEVIVAGIQVRDWLTLTPKTVHIVKQDSARLGVELPDDETPDTAAYVGKTANAILSTNVAFAKDEETGEIIELPDGTKKEDFQHRLQEWLG